jgi:hypothetical protein
MTTRPMNETTTATTEIRPSSMRVLESLAKAGADALGKSKASVEDRMAYVAVLNEFAAKFGEQSRAIWGEKE